MRDARLLGPGISWDGLRCAAATIPNLSGLSQKRLILLCAVSVAVGRELGAAQSGAEERPPPGASRARRQEEGGVSLALPLHSLLDAAPGAPTGVLLSETSPRTRLDVTLTRCLEGDHGFWHTALVTKQPFASRVTSGGHETGSQL